MPGKPGKKAGGPVTTKLIAVDLASGQFTTLPTQLTGTAVQGGIAW